MASGKSINASDFKARCPRVLDDVHATGTEAVITKRGTPVARLSPIGPARGSLRGAWKNRVQIRGDIVQVDWSSDFETALTADEHIIESGVVAIAGRLTTCSQPAHPEGRVG